MHEDECDRAQGKRTPFRKIRDPGMTYAYSGLRRTFPYVLLASRELAADRCDTLVHRVSCFGWISHDHAAVAVGA